MKPNRLMTLLAAGAVSAIALSTAFAQTSSTTTTTNPAVTSSSTTSTSTIDATGTITAYTPGTDYLSFRTETSAEPVKYYYSPKETVLVDSEGATVDWKYLRADMPVRYTYVKEGDRLIVRKITLTKPLAYYEKTTTTTTTTRP